MDSLRSHFLIASPHLHDANFARSVVLMIEHDENGALGLIVNRTTGMKLDAFWKEVRQEYLASAADHVLSLGGPVEGPVMCLHTARAFADMEVLPDLFVASQPNLIHEIIRQDQRPFRIFWGYAGWGAGQLDAEMEAGGWLTTTATAAQIFQDDLDALWKQAVGQSGQDLLRDALGIRQFPEHPGLN